MEKIVEYSRALDKMAWYGEGSMMELARLAKEVGRNLLEDLAERKRQMLDSRKS